MTPFSSNLTRRTLLAGIGASLAVSATPALALTDAQAKALVDGLVTDVNRVIASGKSESAMIRDFKVIFDRYGNVPFIARSALGRGVQASDAQMNAYINAFADYMSRKYGKRFREFVGGRIEVQGARASGRFFEVETTAYLRGEAPFALTFLVAENGNQRRFINMFIEGVNVLSSERTEIRALLDRNGGQITGLTNELKRLG
ncbi:MAG: ABC transporter substrate-binding protein [Pseudomonadota bacterium]